MKKTRRSLRTRWQFAIRKVVHWAHEAERERTITALRWLALMENDIITPRERDYFSDWVLRDERNAEEFLMLSATWYAQSLRRCSAPSGFGSRWNP